MKIVSKHMLLGLLLELLHEETMLGFNPQRLTLHGIIPRRGLCENPSMKGERRSGSETPILVAIARIHACVWNKSGTIRELDQRRWSGFKLVILECLLMLISILGFYWRSKSTFSIIVLLLFLGMMAWDGIHFPLSYC